MMTRFNAVLALSILLTVLSAGCAKKAVSDDALATDIKAKLFSDPLTKAANISVAVKNAAVTLTGDVPGTDVDQQAVSLAKQTPGVSAVTDQLTINQAALTQPPPVTAAPAPVQPTPVPRNTQRPVAQQQAQPAATPAPSVQQPAPVTPTPDASQARPLERQPARPEPVAYTIPAGEHVAVRMIDSIDSKRDQTGQSFQATLYSPLVSHGRVVIPAGTPVAVTLSNAKGAGRIRGQSELAVTLSTINYQGHSYAVQSSVYEETGKARGKQTAVRTGIGAVAGALIGGLAGGGKGAAIGATVAGGGTAGYQLATHGQQVKIPSETILNFNLEASLTVDKVVR